jgi:hypothetical protein
MPAPGTFNLYSAVTPPVLAGDYQLNATGTVGYGDGSGAVDPHRPWLRVVSSRYTMPPDQLLSTFPPANAEGAWAARLPQVVLKRRTLPWERVPGTGPGDADLPWLALVVLAEGEGKLSTEVEVTQCVTPGVTLDGPSDVPKGLYIEVPKSIVDAVFPTKDDLQFLVHVREVDKSDTELAAGDDDGWMAVVLGNRFPQPTVTATDAGPVTTPVRYLACLISVEGQVDHLAQPAPDDDRFHAINTVFDYQAAYVQAYGPPTPDEYAMSASALGGLASAGPRDAAAGPAAPNADVTAVPPVSPSWQVKTAAAPRTGTAESAYQAVRDAMGAPWRVAINRVTAAGDPLYRFPCLAHWSFTTTDGATFEQLMQGLDVGLLGTLPQAPSEAPPPPPRPKPPPQVTATGHVELDMQGRRGEQAHAWYRGALAPHVTERDQPRGGGTLPMAHTSDHLRRVTPDGLEDLTYAAAFEIGRLLALSQPSVVAAQMRWRADQYGASRISSLTAGAFSGVLDAPPGTAPRDLGRLLGGAFLAAAATAPRQVIGPRRPVADPAAIRASPPRHGPSRGRGTRPGPRRTAQDRPGARPGRGAGRQSVLSRVAGPGVLEARRWTPCGSRPRRRSGAPRRPPWTAAAPSPARHRTVRRTHWTSCCDGWATRPRTRAAGHEGIPQRRSRGHSRAPGIHRLRAHPHRRAWRTRHPRHPARAGRFPRPPAAAGRSPVLLPGARSRPAAAGIG